MGIGHQMPEPGPGEASVLKLGFPLHVGQQRMARALAKKLGQKGGQRDALLTKQTDAR